MENPETDETELWGSIATASYDNLHQSIALHRIQSQQDRTTIVVRT